MSISLIEKLLAQMGQAYDYPHQQAGIHKFSCKRGAPGRCSLLRSHYTRILHAATSPDIAIAVGDPAAAARAAVNLIGGMKAFVKTGERVVIKPNMSFNGSIQDATNTHPEIIRELVAMCREAGASKIRVLDHPLRPSEQCIQGAREACSIFGDDIVHALDKKDFYKEVEISKGVSLKETDVMRDVLEYDVLISAPVAKSHGSTGVSLSMKGMMGLVLNRSVMHWRYNLHESVVDLCTILRPRTCSHRCHQGPYDKWSRRTRVP